MSYVTTITCVAIHSVTEHPLFGDGATSVRLESDGAGCYLVLHQPNPIDSSVEGMALDPDELDAIHAAAHMLLAQAGVGNTEVDRASGSGRTQSSTTRAGERS